MRNKLLAVFSLLVLGGLAVFAGSERAWTQAVPVPTVTQINPTDLIQIVPRGQPGPGNVYAPASLITNTTGYLSPVPVTAFTLTFANGQTLFYIRPAGTLATGTFTMAPNPGDGAQACIESTQTQTAVTIAGNTGQTIGGTAVTAMVAGTKYCWFYNAALTTWYPV